MRAGRLRHAVTIQQSAFATADAYGAQAETWTDVEDQRAEVRMLDGTEAWKAKQAQPEATLLVTMRYTAEMLTDRRIKFGTRYLYPLSVVPDVRERELRILCREKL